MPARVLGGRDQKEGNRLWQRLAALKQPGALEGTRAELAYRGVPPNAESGSFI